MRDTYHTASENFTYDDSDPDTEVTIRANGEPVEPGNFLLGGAELVQDAPPGDNMSIEVSTEK